MALNFYISSDDSDVYEDTVYSSGSGSQKPEGLRACSSNSQEDTLKVEFSKGTQDLIDDIKINDTTESHTKDILELMKPKKKVNFATETCFIDKLLDVQCRRYNDAQENGHVSKSSNRRIDTESDSETNPDDSDVSAESHESNLGESETDKMSNIVNLFINRSSESRSTSSERNSSDEGSTVSKQEQSSSDIHVDESDGSSEKAEETFEDECHNLRNAEPISSGKLCFQGEEDTKPTKQFENVMDGVNFLKLKKSYQSENQTSENKSKSDSFDNNIRSSLTDVKEDIESHAGLISDQEDCLKCVNIKNDEKISNNYLRNITVNPFVKNTTSGVDGIQNKKDDEVKRHVIYEDDSSDSSSYENSKASWSDASLNRHEHIDTHTKSSESWRKTNIESIENEDGIKTEHDVKESFSSNSTFISDCDDGNNSFTLGNSAPSEVLSNITRMAECAEALKIGVNQTPHLANSNNTDSLSLNSNTNRIGSNEWFGLEDSSMLEEKSSVLEETFGDEVYSTNKNSGDDITFSVEETSIGKTNLDLEYSGNLIADSPNETTIQINDDRKQEIIAQAVCNSIYDKIEEETINCLRSNSEIQRTIHINEKSDEKNVFDHSNQPFRLMGQDLNSDEENSASLNNESFILVENEGYSVSEILEEQNVEEDSKNVSTQEDRNSFTNLENDADSGCKRKGENCPSDDSFNRSDDLTSEVINHLKSYSSSECLETMRNTLGWPKFDESSPSVSDKLSTLSNSQIQAENKPSSISLLESDAVDTVVLKHLQDYSSSEVSETFVYDQEESVLDNSIITKLNEASESPDDTVGSSNSEGKQPSEEHLSGDGEEEEKREKLAERICKLREDLGALKKQLSAEREKNKVEAAELAVTARRLEETREMSLMMGDTGHAAMGYMVPSAGWSQADLVREQIRAKRMVAAMEFKARLVEVEAECSAELSNLEGVLEKLEPLNRMASYWAPLPQFSCSHLTSSWMRRDFFMEVTRSMNLSSNDGDIQPAINSKESLTKHT